ncbi:Adenylate cyclase [Clarias magur]|uniref:Adenylate cyclase n=1 Tax=Clarias magur TaxID=1594786 RepID=A0A8J4UKS6_CLAMG|nr:Adenylate cyclase [Clarias magur]
MKDGAGCGGRQNVTHRWQETDDFGSQVYLGLSIKVGGVMGCKTNQCVLMRPVPFCCFLWLGNVTSFALGRLSVLRQTEPHGHRSEIFMHISLPVLISVSFSGPIRAVSLAAFR